MAYTNSEKKAPLLDYEGRDIVVEIQDLYKSFGNNHVLKNISMDLYEGENLVVLGRSGTGKSKSRGHYILQPSISRGIWGSSTQGGRRIEYVGTDRRCRP